MEQIILIFHFLFAAALIGLVLLQKGKGASMGAAFGSGASQTVFGSKGSGGFLMKLTLFIAALFFASSITLTYLAKRDAARSSSNDLLTKVEKISKTLHESKQDLAQKPQLEKKTKNTQQLKQAETKQTRHVKTKRAKTASTKKTK